jgi:DNA-directed RNA polymerase subunit RPC12/RpoP
LPQISDLHECPTCFGRLLPLSVCESCNTVAVREGLEEVDIALACEDCGATNPTYFACSACNSRFPFREVVKTGDSPCPLCQSPVPPGAEACANCGAQVGIAGVAREGG